MCIWGMQGGVRGATLSGGEGQTVPQDTVRAVQKQYRSSTDSCKLCSTTTHRYDGLIIWAKCNSSFVRSSTLGSICAQQPCLSQQTPCLCIIRPCGCLWGATCGPAQQQRSGSGGSSSSRRQPHQLVQKSACCFIVLHSCIRDSCSLQRLCKISKAAQSQSARGFWHKRLTLTCCCADYTPLRLSLSSRPSSIHPHYHHNLVH